MKRNSGLIGWIVLIVGLLCSVRGGAVDVGSAAALRDALGNATVSGNVVMLTGDVSLSSTLNITGGTMILDLNGMQISMTKKWEKIPVIKKYQNIMNYLTNGLEMCNLYSNIRLKRNYGLVHNLAD